METLTFKIEDFEGPLDLLLYLVGKNKMNLYEINIMELIEQYTAAIQTMQADHMELSSEFIDMAAYYLMTQEMEPGDFVEKCRREVAQSH